MKKLGFIDDTFLRFESRRQPLHIGTLMLFEPQGEAPKDFVSKLTERLRQSNMAAAPFNQRLVVRRGIHYWKETKDFDLAHHFVHVALPKPGRIRELLAMVSRVHCGHLDRAYPLWRLYLIEGLEDGRFAVYIKVHHALMDGVAGMRLLLKSMSTNLDTSLELPPPWEVPTKKSRTRNLPVPSPATGSLAALRSLAREHVNSVIPVLKEVRSNIRDIWNRNPDFVFGGQAPRSLFNQKVSATRRFAAQSYSTPRIKAVADHYQTTMNDVVLAMCGSALRRYLMDLHELPDRPLVAAVPVSVRRDNSELSNEISFTFAHLGTHLSDARERMVAIKNCMDYNKAHLRKLSPDQSLVSGAIKLLPGALNAITGFSPDSVLGNVIISHVPGPRRTMYWQGAKLCGLYPASLVVDYGALNITLISRHDFVDVGIIACRKTVPQMQRLLKYLEDALVELEDTMQPAGPSSTPTATSTTAQRPEKDTTVALEN
ncbi:MAG: wax ester/triacylglycerol synthase family O-acyltransferase [Pseudomonadota bacterium]|nr:wax ester/triacylglycerol synthase family O-acyltransferase [Pseudomonadota bacterium]